jgi:hypothetical protein
MEELSVFKLNPEINLSLYLNLFSGTSVLKGLNMYLKNPKILDAFPLYLNNILIRHFIKARSSADNTKL